MPHKDPELRAAYHKAYRKEHAERLRQINADWRAANRESLLLGKREHYQQNKAAYIACADAQPYWFKKFHKALAKARRAGAEIVDTDSIREYYRQVFSQTSAVCIYCRGEFAIGDITIDHKEPYALGGRHMVSNFAVSCCSCNVKKHTTPFATWIAKR